MEEIPAAVLDAMGRYNASCASDGIHHIPLEEAFSQAFADMGQPQLARPFYLAAEAWWNDLEDWARGIE